MNNVVTKIEKNEEKKEKPSCGLHLILHSIGKKFSLSVLLEIRNNSFSFNDFIRKTQITPKLLSERLKELQKQKLIEKNYKIEKYILTEKGKEFCTLIDSIKKFEAKYENVPNNCAETICSECNYYPKP